MEKLQIVTLISLCVFVYIAVNAEQCVKEGLICDDCNHVAFCASNGNGGFIVQVIEECKDGQTCLNATCTSQYNPKCIEIKFLCSAIGMFPDPMDCKKFHVCYRNDEDELQSYDSECDGNYGYDMVSTFCKTPLLKGCPAKPPVPQCMKSGQSGALANKSIYYVCGLVDNILYPFLNMCPNGKPYNGKNCSRHN